MNDRELASLIWLAVIAAWFLSARDRRSMLGPCVRTLAHPMVAGPLLAYVAYTAGLVLAASALGIWHSGLLGDTTVWFVATGVVVIYDKAVRLFESGSSIRGLVAAAVGISVLAEGYMNLVVLPLPVELIVLPVITGLSVLAIVARADDENEPVRKLLDGVLALVGVCAFVFVTIRLVSDFDAAHVGEALVLPVWLTLGVIPFALGIGLICAYQRAFGFIRVASDDPERRTIARRAVLVGLHLHGRRVASINLAGAPRLLDAASFRDAVGIARRRSVAPST